MRFPLTEISAVTPFRVRRLARYPDRERNRPTFDVPEVASGPAETLRGAPVRDVLVLLEIDLSCFDGSYTFAPSNSLRCLSSCLIALGSAPNSARCPSMVWIGRNSALGIIRHSAWQSAGGKNISDDIGMTKVLARIRLNAARRSPPVWRLTSPRCHFHAMHKRLLGSITLK